MGAETKKHIRSRVLQFLSGALLSIVLALAIARYFFVPQDRTRCQGMLDDGWWLGEHYDRWQPSGCMSHTYNAQQISNCLNHSRVLYVGDSIMREQFTSMGSFLPDAKEEGASAHEDKKFTSSKYGMTIELWWDPYINQTRTSDMLSNMDPDNQPSLLIIGSGPWYMKNLAVDEYFDAWKDRIDAVLDAVESPAASVANTVLLSPVEIPQSNLLNKERGATITRDKIDRMNEYLHSRLATLNPQVPFAVPFAWNAIAASTINMTLDGLHYLPGVTKVQAQLALNFRCNEELPKQFPFETTCCTSYPAEAWYQIAILLFFMIWIPIGFFVVSIGVPLLRGLYPSSISMVTSLFVFGLGVVYMYLGDRTQLFGKAHKFFDPFTFGLLMLGTLVGGLVTLHRFKTEGGDQGFLNRAQTDEWKGWMQIIILVYHFTGASGTAGIYNAMRVLVAAYLFQTGYGHFFFFYKKGDFGFERVMNVLVRLNLLTLVLEYIMDTNYLSYYFTPLVTFWFGVIWLTMFIGHSQNKTKPWFVLLKITVAGLLTGLFIHVPGVLETTFEALRFLFNIHWDAAEWRFRLALDAWIVYVGMLFAFGTIKFSEKKLHEHALWPAFKTGAVVGSVGSLVWYFWFELSMPNKQAYTVWHPYMSWIPILAFIVLRNATVGMRNTTSGFYEFIGKCSLETFIGQFHMWLAADTKGLLVLLPDPSWAQGLGWWLNLALSSVVFVFVCYYLSKTTGEITKWIITSAQEQQHKQQMKEEHRMPLLPTATTTTTASSSSPVIEGEDESEWKEGRPSRWRKIASDLRVKTAVFLLALAVLNHFC